MSESLLSPSLLDLSLDNPAGDGQMLLRPAGFREKPLHKGTQDRRPEPEGANSAEGVEGIVDRHVQPFLIAADLVAQEDQGRETGNHIRSGLGKDIRFPF